MSLSAERFPLQNKTAGAGTGANSGDARPVPFISNRSDCFLLSARCSGCGRELGAKAPAESYRTHAGFWAVIFCIHCNCWSPFRLEITP